MLMSFGQIPKIGAGDMERELAFSTFVKLLELPAARKAMTLRGFQRGGGFSYWRPLQTLAPDVARRRLDLAAIQAKMSVMAKGHQRKYNENALTNLAKWAARKKILVRTRREKVVVPLGSSGLSVRLEPELAFSVDGRSYLMHIWATNDPSLTDETLSMGLYFFRNEFRKAHREDAQYVIFDCVKNRIFSEINIFDSAEDMLEAQCSLLDKIWHDLEEGAARTKRRPPEQRPGVPV
jgi:hypothetical protein